MGFPHGHRKTTTFIAGLRLGGMVAPMVLDRPINGAWFEAYVEQVLGGASYFRLDAVFGNFGPEPQNNTRCLDRSPRVCG